MRAVNMRLIVGILSSRNDRLFGDLKKGYDGVYEIARRDLLGVVARILGSGKFGRG